eukprot:scaffold6879_cov63-Cylindrotheca_fusiformis.AAC.2
MAARSSVPVHRCKHSSRWTLLIPKDAPRGFVSQEMFEALDLTESGFEALDLTESWKVHHLTRSRNCLLAMFELQHPCEVGIRLGLSIKKRKARYADSEQAVRVKKQQVCSNRFTNKFLYYVFWIRNKHERSRSHTVSKHKSRKSGLSRCHLNHEADTGSTAADMFDQVLKAIHATLHLHVGC